MSSEQTAELRHRALAFDLLIAAGHIHRELADKALSLAQGIRVDPPQPAPAVLEGPSATSSTTMVCTLCGGRAEMVADVWRHADKPPELVICDKYGYPIEVKPEPSAPRRRCNAIRNMVLTMDPLLYKCEYCGGTWPTDQDAPECSPPCQPVPAAQEPDIRSELPFNGWMDKPNQAAPPFQGKPAQEPPSDSVTGYADDQQFPPAAKEFIKKLLDMPLPERLAFLERFNSADPMKEPAQKPVAPRQSQRYLVEVVPTKDLEHIYQRFSVGSLTIETGQAMSVKPLEPISAERLQNLCHIFWDNCNFGMSLGPGLTAVLRACGLTDQTGEGG